MSLDRDDLEQRRPCPYTHASTARAARHVRLAEACCGACLQSTPSVGDDSAEDPPDPIPNSEVKLQRADGTARVTLWESRSRRPPYLWKAPRIHVLGAFFVVHAASPGWGSGGVDVFPGARLAGEGEEGRSCRRRHGCDPTPHRAAWPDGRVPRCGSQPHVDRRPASRRHAQQPHPASPRGSSRRAPVMTRRRKWARAPWAARGLDSHGRVVRWRCSERASALWREAEASAPSHPRASAPST